MNNYFPKYVELNNPIESAVALDNESVLIRGVFLERLALWGCLWP